MPGGTADRSGIAAHLKRLRLRAGLSQEALAEKAGVSVATIGALEEGQRRRPYPNTLRALADSLDLSAADRATLLAARDDGSVPHEPVLPVPLTALVGREAEVKEVAALLRSATTRLVTLVGPGGVGKTRLAIEVAGTVRADYHDGVAFVDLAPLHDHRLVAATIARVLGVHELGGRSAWELVQAHLRARHMLLVLDNFEHLLGAAPLLIEVLGACPQLSLLVTSRSALRLRAERRQTVGPLPAPGRAQSFALAELLTFPAVRLFVDRLHAVAPDFKLDENNAATVAEICRQLDGIPLALELAAARVQLLSPSALLHRLEHRLHLLSDGPVDLPERQRTLRGTLAWSYDLLEPADQALYRRLAVFSGGWTIEAAEAVGTGPGIAAEDVLQGLGTLVDNSLVRPLDHFNGEPYFGMLETVREYALDRLQAEGEEGDARMRHLGFYLALAEMAEPHLDGGDRTFWADRLEREHDNLRAGMTCALHAEQPALGLRLALALRFFWYQHGHLREGSDRLQAALAAAEATVDSTTRGRGLAALGYLLALQGEFAQARLRLEAALVISRDSSDDAARAFALRYLGFVAAADGDGAQAADYLEESLAVSRRLGLSVASAFALMYLGDVVLQRMDLDRAQQYFEESSALLSHLENTTGLSYPLRRLGHIARLRGDIPLAISLCLQSLAHNRASGDRQGIAACLVGLAQVDEVQGRPGAAVRLLGLADTVASTVGGRLLPFDAEQFVATQAKLREQLDAAAWAQAWQEGQGLSLGDAVSAVQYQSVPE